eukprot:879541_1
MALLSLIFHFAFLWQHGRSTSNPFINEGPYEIQQYDDSFYFHPYQNLSYALSIYVPNSEPGTYNTILFLTGLDGICPSFMYSDVFSHISSYGYIIVSASLFDFDTNVTLRTSEIEETINWVVHDLEDNMQKNGIDTTQIKPDVTQLCIGSHSSAAHPVVQFLNTSCSIINSVWLQDPVDCHSPYKPDVDCVTTPGKKLPFAVPLFHVETGLDPVSAGLGPPCAPIKESNQRFVDAWNGPVYQINATQFGHMDNETHCDNDECRSGIGGWVVSIEPQTWLNNITLIPKQYYNGYNTQTAAFCKRQMSE